MLRSKLAVIGIGLSLLGGGCAKTGPGPADGLVPAKQAPATAPSAAATGSPAASSLEVVATVNGQPITLDELQAPLIEAHGLNVLLHLMQRDLAKQEAAMLGVSITPEDVERERKQTLDTLFQDAHKKLEADLDKASAKKDEAEVARLRELIRSEREKLLANFLSQQGVSLPEFQIVLQTSAYLRKVAEKNIPTITDEAMREEFRQDFGEKARVRHIQCANIAEVMAAKAELKKGVPFEEVAKRRSRNERTRGLGGELPAFSRAMTNVPEELKNVAFGLSAGEVSDPVQIEGAYHLVQLVELIPPKAVKYEDMTDWLRQRLVERWVQVRMNELRQQHGQLARDTMDIKNPVLRAQFEEKKKQAAGETQDREAIRQDLAKQRDEQLKLLAPVAEPATQSTVPTTQRAAGTTQRTTGNRVAGERPPATQSGSASTRPD